MGTSKICVLIGCLDDKGNINIIGHGEKNSDGAIVKSEITDMEKTTNILFDAIHVAESVRSGLEPQISMIQLLK